jgi:4,5-dihydroxyphthalate decarboxylase
MSALPLTLATRSYDFILPLVLGDVEAEGLDLTFVRGFRILERVLTDPAVQGGEASFSRYVQRLARGDRAFVGLPAFLMREFRHRNFFVRRDSGLRDLKDLHGARIGLDGWPNSGNTWSRGLLREAGVPVDAARWVVGAVNPGEAAPAADALPAGVTTAPAGRALRDMLVAGDLDVLIVAWAPAGFYEPDSPIVRLFPDYRRVERDYYRRTGIFPAHHIVVLRRDVVDARPDAVPRLYTALCRAREHAVKQRLLLHESSPWQLAELEEEAALHGPGFEFYGARANRAMIAAFCAEQSAQGLVPRPIEPDEVFAEFERLAK